VSGILVIAAAFLVAKLLRRGDEVQLAEESVSPAAVVAVQQPCA
jgi:hypothetical protein